MPSRVSSGLSSATSEVDGSEVPSPSRHISCLHDPNAHSDVNVLEAFWTLRSSSRLCNTPAVMEPNLSDIEWDRKPSQSTDHNLKRKRVDIDLTAFERDFQYRLSLSEEPGYLQHSNSKRTRVEPVSPPREFSQLPCFRSDERPCIPPLAIRSYRRRMSGPRSSLLPLNAQPSSSPSNLSAAPSNFLMSPEPTKNSTCSSVSPTITQTFFSQRLSWRTSRFTEWSSLPPLTLKCLTFQLPFSPHL